MDLNFKMGQRPNYLQGVQISEEKKKENKQIMKGI
jgi:hypothetical protein